MQGNKNLGRNIEQPHHEGRYGMQKTGADDAQSDSEVTHEEQDHSGFIQNGDPFIF